MVWDGLGFRNEKTAKSNKKYVHKEYYKNSVTKQFQYIK